MFTVDPISQNKKTIVIESVYGLGELIVSGQVTPDHYEIDKDDFNKQNDTDGEADEKPKKVQKRVIKKKKFIELPSKNEQNKDINKSDKIQFIDNDSDAEPFGKLEGKYKAK